MPAHAAIAQSKPSTPARKKAAPRPRVKTDDQKASEMLAELRVRSDALTLRINALLERIGE